MLNLTKEEILSELKKFGINSTGELNSYYRDYKKYSINHKRKFLTRRERSIRRKVVNKKNVKAVSCSEEQPPQR